MDYKQTLLLPNTTFAMRGNLAQTEPIRIEAWEKKGVYEKMKRLRSDAEPFTLHDGPPYANGHIHIGHALNKILKDIIVKLHYFNNKSVRFTPGWDCHGLPIEQQVEKKLGGKQKKEQKSTAEIRTLCREHAASFVDVQREEFKRLGIIADWDNPYVTMDFAFEANIYRTLCSVASSGLLVERSKPVFWSWAERTALAEAEVEYEDKEDYSIYVAFQLDDAAKEAIGATGDASVVIWTTTPWTLPANSGISLHPEEMYVWCEDGSIVARARYEALIDESVIHGTIVKEFKGSALEGCSAINPLNARGSTIVLGEHVLMDNGSGCVHTAPGHGEDDYRVGLKYNLDVIMPVDETGCYDETIVSESLFPNATEFVGQHIFKMNEPIIEMLGSAVKKVSKFTHSYPHCWRSHTPLIFRATKQWFVAVDEPFHDDITLRQLCEEGVDTTTFYPQSGVNRLGSMVKNRPDWCISRQRDWGVPIAFFREKSSGKVVLDEKVLNFIAMIFEQQGSDAWYALPIASLLYPGSGYNPDDLEKVTDILDVWFDSGSTWNAVLNSRNYDAGKYPADLYLEGSDQHRGWFQSSLFLSMAVQHQTPYKSIITHGFTNDAKGQKMSKSKGNVIAPEKVVKQYGAEILRLWVASSDYQNDQKISDDILKQSAEQYRKIRNTFRILLANIDDLDALCDESAYSALDVWMLSKASKVFNEVHAHFLTYDFVNAMNVLNYFIVNELSGIYIDVTKDRIYCDAKTSLHRRASQSVMFQILDAMLTLLAPILTHTTDEILEHAPALLKADTDDIFEKRYTPIAAHESTFDEAYFKILREKFYEQVDYLKKEKVIKSTLELEIVTADAKLFTLPQIEVEDWFVVSAVKQNSTTECLAEFTYDEQVYEIRKSGAYKCPRCWKFHATCEDGLCKRCQEVLDADA